MAKSCFLGLKRVQIVVFGQEIFFGKIGQKWPKYGEKLFFRPKKGPNSGFWPRNFFLTKLVKKWPKYGEKLISGPKKGPNSGFWPKFFFGQIGQKMAEIWQKVVFQA